MDDPLLGYDKSPIPINETLRQNTVSEDLIHFDGHLISTKHVPEDVQAVLQINVLLEYVTKQTFLKPEVMKSRLQSYDRNYDFNGFVNHSPVKTIECNGEAIGRNLFLASSKGNRLEDQSGVELMSSWHSHNMQVIYPVVKAIFDRDSIIAISRLIDPGLLELYIYWLSLAHEHAHNTGPYRIFQPYKDFLKLAPQFQGTLAETAANATAALLTPEHPGIALWILLFNLAFTGRKGYRSAPTKGLINSDVDSLAAVLLYQHAVRDGILEITSDCRLHLNLEPLLPCYERLRSEIDELACEAFKLPKAECNRVFQEWLKTQIPFDGEEFVFPRDLQQIYSQVQTIPEYPQHVNLLS
jgi:hypothetical protein